VHIYSSTLLHTLQAPAYTKLASKTMLLLILSLSKHSSESQTLRSLSFLCILFNNICVYPNVSPKLFCESNKKDASALRAD